MSSILPADLQVHYSAQQPNSQHNLSLTQQHINEALFNSNSPSYSVQPLVKKLPSPVASTSKDYHHELHMAEILVESAAYQQRSAFQFDTITPKKKIDGIADAPLSSVMLDSGIELSCALDTVHSRTSTLNSKENSNVDELEEFSIIPTDDKCGTVESSSSDDNGGFVTPPEDKQGEKKNKVKRATVVGNAMFSSSPECEEMGGPGQSLGLDDMDMDYEQIMHYFDNLKVCSRNLSFK